MKNNARSALSFGCVFVAAILFGSLSVMVMSCDEETSSGTNGRPQDQKKDPCTASRPECTDGNAGYRVCISGSWSDVISCNGAVCEDGACVSGEVTSKLPCDTVREKACVSVSRIMVCDENNYWSFMNCPVDVPVCDFDKNDCTVAQCHDSDPDYCFDDHTITTCTNHVWTPSQCPDDKPVCIKGKCQEPPKECEPNAKECLSDSVSRVCNAEGFWENIECTDGTACLDVSCKACQDEEYRCDEDNRTFKSCRNGKWKAEICPVDYPICREDIDQCSPIEDQMQCSSGAFTFCDEKNSKIAYCNRSSKLQIIDCDKCLYSADEKSVVCDSWNYKQNSLSKDYSECQKVGEIRGGLFNEIGIVYKDALHFDLINVTCAECKYMQDRSLRWVPVDESYCGK